jgi:hypothetical protein
MALAIPFATLLVTGAPLGVLGYLYAMGKRGENGATPMAESGVRAELNQALRAEYAAFAAVDRAAIVEALTNEMTRWKNEHPQEEAPTIGSRALQATGALLAAPIALPVAGVVMAYTAAIDYMKKRATDAAEKKAELEAAKKTQESKDARYREAKQKEDEARALNDTATLNASITLGLRLKAEADKAEADRQSAARAATAAAAAAEAAARAAGEEAAVAAAAARAAGEEAAAAEANEAVSEASLARIEAAADGAAAEAAERKNSDPAPSQSNVATPILGPAAVDPAAIAFAERNAAAVESGGPSAFGQAFPVPNEEERLKAVAEDKSLAAQAPSQTSSDPTPDAKSQETCEPKVYLEKRKALIDALENRARFRQIPKLWSKFVDTCLQGDSPPMPLSREWRAAGQDVVKQKAALVNLVATLKTMGVLDDTLEDKIVSNWMTELGGRRRRKARNSTFRRHRKH